jgi:hypothetical protein
MKLAVITILTGLWLLLIRKRFLRIDLSFPWFAALAVLAFASMSDRFVNWVATRFGIDYQPIALVLVAIFLLLGLTAFLLVALGRLRTRQEILVRHLAQADLARQESVRAMRPRDPSTS